MRVSLINLGDADRGLHDINNRFVSVPIGEIVSADLSDKTLKNLTKFQKTDTLLVGPPGTFSPPVRLRVVLELLKVIDTEPYEVLLRQFLEVCTPRSSMDIRPNRGQMRAALRGVVENYLREVQRESENEKSSGDETNAGDVETERRRIEAAETEQRRAEAATASRRHEQRRRARR